MSYDEEKRLAGMLFDLGRISAQMDRFLDENKRLREALKSIADNTCCDKCQEAALVAKSALGEGGE